jgi:TPP-dependent 2-oxoacid decarboxylase
MQLVNEIGLTKGVRPVLCLQENTVTGAADGYGRMAGKPAFIERALEENPNWTYNDLAPWRYAVLPRALGCADWFTARVATLRELDAAMKTAEAMYGDAP